MNIRLFNIFLAAFSFISSRAFAQDLSEVPPPSPPFVAQVAEKMDWTVTVKYPQKPPPPPDTPQPPDWRIAEVHSTRTGTMKRDIIKSMDGTSKEHWFIESLLLWPNLQGEVSVSDMAGAGEARPADDDSPSVPSGFPGVGWINLNGFKDVVIFEKQPCYHYAAGNMEAWINMKTQLPVAYKSAGALYKFIFNDQPANPLVLPPAYQKAWDVTQKVMSNRKRVWKDLGAR